MMFSSNGNRFAVPAQPKNSFRPQSFQFQAPNPFLRKPLDDDPQLKKDMELLNSLKTSLGILNAQALNVKQRTVLLYQEAKRRRLLFFDGLLKQTHRFT